MREEIAILRARQDWDPDILYNEIASALRQMSRRLSLEAVYLAAERFDYARIERLWGERDHLLGLKLQDKFLAALKRQKRKTELQRLLLHIFETEIRELPGEKIKFVIRWVNRLSNELVRRVISDVDSEYQWMLCSQMTPEFFEVHDTYLARHIFPRLITENPRLFYSMQRLKPWSLVNDLDFQRALFWCCVKQGKRLCDPCPALVDHHFDWYIEAVKSGELQRSDWCWPVYPFNVYIGDGDQYQKAKKKMYNYSGLTTTDFTREMLQSRLRRLCQVYTEDLPVDLDIHALLGAKLRKIVGDAPEYKELWRVWSKWYRSFVESRAGIAASERIPKQTYENPKFHFLRNTVDTLAEAKDQLPPNIISEVKWLIELSEDYDTGVMLLFNDYWQSEVTWLDYLRTHPALPEADVQQASLIQAKLTKSVQDEFGKLDTTFLAIVPANKTAAMRLGSYEGLLEDIRAHFDVNEFRGASGTQTAAQIASEIARAYSEEPESLMNPLFAASSSVSDYLHRFQNPKEIEAALILLGYYCTYQDPAPTSGNMRYLKHRPNQSDPDPYNTPIMSGAELTQKLEEWLLKPGPDLIDFARHTKDLPYCGARTYILSRIILSTAAASIPDDKTRQKMYNFWSTELVNRVSFPPLVTLGSNFLFATVYLPAYRSSQDVTNDRSMNTMYPLCFSEKKPAAEYRDALQLWAVQSLAWQKDRRIQEPDDSCHSRHYLAIHGESLANPQLPIPLSLYRQQTELLLPLQVLLMLLPSYYIDCAQHRSYSRLEPRKGLSHKTVERSRELARYYELCGDNLRQPSSLPPEIRLKHQSHRRGRLCRACKREAFLQSGFIALPSYMRTVSRFGLADKIVQEAAACRKGNNCKLVDAMRWSYRLASAHYHASLKPAGTKDGTVLAGYGPQLVQAKVRRELSGQPTSALLQILYWACFISRINADDERQALPRVTRSFGDLLSYNHIKALGDQIPRLKSAVPLALSGQDEVGNTAGILEQEFLSKVDEAANGLRGLRSVQGFVIPARLREILGRCDTTRCQAQKARIECLVASDSRFLKNLCIGEVTEARIRRLKSLNDLERTLFTGLLCSQIDDPDCHLCVRRINGADTTSSLNGLLGNGAGLERVLKVTPPRTWTETELAKYMRQHLALQLLASDVVRVQAAAFECISTGTAAKISSESAAAKQLWECRRADHDYLTVVRQVVRFGNLAEIAQYYEYMKGEQMSPRFVQTWLICALGAYIENHKEDVVRAHDLLDLPQIFGHLMFAGRWGRSIDVCKEIAPELAWVESVDID